MKFWDHHAEEMRRARLLQASAILSNRYGHLSAVDLAFALERQINNKLKKEKNIERQSVSGS